MGTIQVLDEGLCNLIAAGEVIERAKSVVKELVENSIDAGAKNIKIKLQNGGLTEIRVIDDGCGMDANDASICFLAHATSKIKSQSDLFNIRTLGFRGEALASIVAVSSFNLKTSVDGYHGVMLSLKGGIPLSSATLSHPRGTEITVKNLFFNTPARLQHMKSPNVELAYITDFVSKMAIARSDISFSLSNNDKELLHTSGNGNQLETISEIYSTSIAREMMEIFDNNGLFKVSGYISKISVTKSSKNNIILCLNGRLVYNKSIVNAIKEGYGNLLMPNKYPIAVININVDLGMVDVNVHPTKYEVRLSDEATLKDMLINIISKTLASSDLSVNVSYDDTDLGISNYEEEIEDNNTIKEDALNQAQLEKAKQEEIEEAQTSNTIQEDRIVDTQTAISNLDNIDLDEDKDEEVDEDNEDYDDDLDHLEDYINPEVYQATDEDINALNDRDKYQDEIEDIPYEDQQIEEYQNQIQEDLKDIEEEKIIEEKPVQTALNFLDEENIIYDNDKSRLQKMYYIGQLFGTYILAQNEDNFFLIDQHAANERVNYEKIKKEFMKENVASYDLLVPFTLEFSPSDKILVEEYMDDIKKFGIELDEFGSNTYVLRSIPIWFFRGKEKEFAEEIINRIIHAPKGQDFRKADFLDDIAATMACKRSIKGNEYHTSLEIEYLIEELAKCDNPFTCPHGRPVIVKITKADVEKWFKRIVS